MPTSEWTRTPRSTSSTTRSTRVGWPNARAKRLPKPAGTGRNGTERRTAAVAAVLWVSSPPTQISRELLAALVVAQRRKCSSPEKTSRVTSWPRARSASRSWMAVAMARPLPDPGVATISTSRAGLTAFLRAVPIARVVLRVLARTGSTVSPTPRSSAGRQPEMPETMRVDIASRLPADSTGPSAGAPRGGRLGRVASRSWWARHRRPASPERTARAAA
jgi:hypothetical protein